jgi:prophage antirepressor-like protein
MEIKNQFIEFNDHQIAVVAADGTQWVALKPLCEALGVNYKNQHASLLQDDEIGQLSSIQKTTGSDGKTYDMVCLPYELIYGYLFTIRSKSTVLKEYRMKCYYVLYEYFHNIIGQRKQLLKERRDTTKRIAELEAKFQAEDDYQELLRLRKVKKRLPSKLGLLDKDLEEKQLDFDF